MRNTLAAALVAASFAFVAPVLAQPNNSTEIAAIRAEIAALSARLERLEQATAATSVASAPAASPAPSAAVAEAPRVVEPRVAAAVAPNVRFSGDLRYRHESINEEGEAERHRQRIRARFGVTADVAENVRVGLTLATGGDDPVSANQTLDTGFSRKPIGVDRAFFSWAATDELTFTGGKIANPFYRPGNHHLIYDADLNVVSRCVTLRQLFRTSGLWVEGRPPPTTRSCSAVSSAISTLMKARVSPSAPVTTTCRRKDKRRSGTARPSAIASMRPAAT
jgi:hypothetical protein